MLQSMAAVRYFAAAVFICLASTVTAQNVAITVVDQSGAVIPGAHIGIIKLPSVVPNGGDWRHYALHASEQTSTRTDAHGEATVGLAKGTYTIAIAANGFRSHFDKVEIRDEANQILRVILVVGGCTECVTVMPAITIPLELASLNAFIPLEPLRTITVAPARIQRRWLRF